MKKITSDPKNYIKEMLEGIYIAYPDKVAYVNDDLQYLIDVHSKEGKADIATGGGSGHPLLSLGYIGDGMSDGCCAGDVFQSPSVGQMLAVTKHIDQGVGVFYIYRNYNGDTFNLDMAAEMADSEYGTHVKTVLGVDGVAPASPRKEGDKSTRRDVADIVSVYKCAGTVASRMMTLDKAKQIAEEASHSVRTMGVALTPYVVSRVDKAGFEIGLDEMKAGMGIHGETGIRRGKIESADQITDEMLNKIIADLPYTEDDKAVVLVSGLSATPLDEQYIAVCRIQENLTSEGIKVHRYHVDEFATALEVAGLSISLPKLDEELKELLGDPADTPSFKQ